MDGKRSGGWSLFNWCKRKPARRSGRLGATWFSRVRSTLRTRFLRMESLEERSLLAAIAKFDFDNAAGETGPAGWIHFFPNNPNNPNNQVFDNTAQIGLKLTSGSPTGFTSSYNASTIPSDATGIRNGIVSPLGGNLTFAFTNLNPLKSYEIWVLGGASNSGAVSQQVSIQGADANQPFTQTIASQSLEVNSFDGTSAKAIADFAPIFVQSPYFDGDLSTNAISVTTSHSSGGQARLAGFVIREFDAPPSSATLPASGGPFSLVVENGNRVLKNNSGGVVTGLANTGPITINGTSGANDVLNVDLSGGNPLAGGLTFNGGEGAGDDDGLRVAGYNLAIADGVADVTVTHTGPEAGSVTLADLGTINFSEIEPLVLAGTAADLVITLPAGPNLLATLGNDGVAPFDGVDNANTSAIYSTAVIPTFEYTEFTNPTNSLKINRGSASDNLAILDLFASGLTASLSIGAVGSEFNNITFNGPVTLGSGKSLSANAAGTIGVNVGVGISTSGSGSVSLTTAKNIALDINSSINTGSGAITLSANQQVVPSAGDFVGVNIDGATVKSTSGPIAISGRGGGGLANQIGVYLRGQALVGDTTTAAVTVNGRGGNSPLGSQGGNVGVIVVENSAVKSNGGNIVLNGTGGMDADDEGLNHGVQVDQSSVNAGGAGTLTVTGTGVGPGSFGVFVAIGGEALKTASGQSDITGTGETGVFINATAITSSNNIQITGTALVSGNPGIRVAGSVNTDDSGNIRLVADSLDLQGGVDAQTRVVTIVPLTPGRPIILGETDNPTELSISDSEQNTIKAGTLIIGDTASGPLTVVNDITRPTVELPTLPANINLTSNGAISFASGLLNSAGGNVVVSPGSSASFAKAGTDLNVGSGTASFASGADAIFAINGTTVDASYQQLNLTGNINLTGADLVVTGSHTPVAGNSFVVVKYTGTRTGTFNNGTVMLNGETLNIVYDDANKQVRLRLPGATSLNATLTGGDLTITDLDVAGKANQLTVSVSGSDLVIADANEAFEAAPPGGVLSNDDKTLTIPLSLVTGVLTVNGAGGSDTITVNALPGLLSGLTINGGAGNDAVSMNGDITFVAGKGLDLDLQNDHVTPGVDSIALGGNVNLLLSGSGAATLKASKNIAVPGGASIEAVDGSLALEANQQASATSGSFFHGVEIAGTVQVTGTGTVTVLGKGGDTGLNPMGVWMHDGGTLSGGTSGLVKVIGRAVSGTGSNSDFSGGSRVSGVQLTGTTTKIITQGANIEVTGYGGAATAMSAYYSMGVDVQHADIVAGGNGSITIEGHGGSGEGGNARGVALNGGFGQIATNNGAVTIRGFGGNGTGNQFGANNTGVSLEEGFVVLAGGTHLLSVEGTGGTGSQGGNNGVAIFGTGPIPSFRTGGGSIQITGIPGSSGGGGFANLGIGQNAFGEITTQASGGNITLIADSMDLRGSIQTQTSGQVMLRPRTVAVAIDIGSNTDPGSGPLSFSATELNGISTGTLQIGHALTGSIVVSDNVLLEGKNLALVTGIAISGTGAIANDSPATATVSFDQAGNSTFGGVLGGAAGGTANEKNLTFVKLGEGQLTLTGASTFTGTTTVSAGTLLVSGTLPAAGAVLVENGATLGGTGTTGPVTIADGGKLAPGSSPGIFNTGSVTFDTGSIFAVELNGTTVGMHDQQNVTGSVAINGGLLQVTLGFTPMVGDSFTILNNDDTDAVSGTLFADLPEGKVFSVITGGFSGTFQISYRGGSGNDVVLKTLSATDPIVEGTSDDDVFVLRRTGALGVTQELTRDGIVIFTAPYASLTSLTVNGLAGNDRLTVDFVGGNPLLPGGIAFNGGTNGGGSGDMLYVKGTGTQDLEYLPSATMPGNGTISGLLATTGSITFTGLEPVDISDVATLTLTTPLGIDNLTIADGTSFFAPATNAVRVSGNSGGVAIETLAAWNISGRLNLFTDENDGTPLAGDVNDTITILGATARGPGSANIEHLAIVTGGTGDVVHVNGPVTVGGINLDSGTINVNALIDAGNTTSWLMATGAIVDGNGSALNLITSALNLSAGTGIDLDAAINSLNAEVTGAGDLAVRIQNGGAQLGLVAARNGNATVTAAAGSPLVVNSRIDYEIFASGTVSLIHAGGTIRVDGTIVGGNVVLAADTQEFNNTITATGTATLRPFTTNREIDLGTEDANKLSLTQAELNQITAGRIVVGSGDAGAVLFTQPISLANSNVLEVISGSTINDTGSNTVFTDASLALNAAAGVGTTSPLNVAVSNLAVTAAAGGVSIANVGDVHLATVGSVMGVTATNSTAKISAASTLFVDQVVSGAAVDLSATSGVTINAAVSGGAGGVLVNSDSDADTNGSFNLTAVTGSIATTGGGAVSITAPDMTLSSTINAGSGLASLISSGVGRQIDLGTKTIGTLSLTDAELDRIVAGTISIGDANSGTITVSAAIDRTSDSTTAINLTTGGNNSIVFGNAGSMDAKNGNVTLQTNSSGSGAITSGTAATDVTGANLSLTAGSAGIGVSGNPLAFVATNLSSMTGGNGNQFLSASSSTTVDSAGLSAGTGTIELDGGTFSLGGGSRIADSSKLNVNGATFAIGTNDETVDTLTLSSGSVTGSSGVLTSTNTIQTKSGSISAILAGTNGLTQTTTGTTTLSGTNTYSGNTTISNGVLKLGGANVIPDGADKGNIVFNPASGTATLDLAGFNEAVNGLSNSGAGTSFVDNTASGGPFTLSVGGNDQSGSFGGTIRNTTGVLALSKTGVGTFTLIGANSYSGATTVSGGVLLVNGSTAAASAGSVASGATLGGTGTFAGAIAVASGGHLAPGTSPGTLNSGSIALASGAIFDVELNGASAGQFDQQNVTGAVDVTGSMLNLTLGFAPTSGSFTIIANDGSADAVVGTFSGLPEGMVFTRTTGGNTATFQITYQGGDGNDVVLKAMDAANPVLDGTTGNDTWLVRQSGGNFEITLNSNVILSVPTLTSLTINGLAGNDTLTVDQANGNAIPSGNITFNGGESAGDDDRLRIVGYNLPVADGLADVTVTHTGAEAGNVVLNGLGTVAFTQIEPLALVGTAADLVITLPAGPNPDATLGNDGIAAYGDGTDDANTSAVYDSTTPGATFEYTEFTNPTNSLRINRGSNTDNLTVLDLVASGLNSSLTIGAAASEFNAVTFNGPITLAADKSLAVNASGTISLPAAAKIATSGTGSVNLATTRNITQAANSTVTTVNGGITLSANRQATPTAANFVGITVNGSISTSGTGNISLSGRGGNATGVNDLYGIWLSGGQVKSTATGVNAGTITITGTGGTGSSTSFRNAGVVIENLATSIASVDGSISITGNATTTAGSFHDGIRQTNTGGVPRIDITGSGNLTLTGRPGVTTGGANSLGLRLFSLIDVTGPQTTLIANRMALDLTNFSLNAHTNTVTLRPDTTNTPIDLGAAADSNATVTWNFRVVNWAESPRVRCKLAIATAARFRSPLPSAEPIPLILA
jgi:autotransporter-associated beta strand protein